MEPVENHFPKFGLWVPYWRLGSYLLTWHPKHGFWFKQEQYICRSWTVGNRIYQYSTSLFDYVWHGRGVTWSLRNMSLYSSMGAKLSIFHVKLYESTDMPIGSLLNTDRLGRPKTNDSWVKLENVSITRSNLKFVCGLLILSRFELIGWFLTSAWILFTDFVFGSIRNQSFVSLKIKHQLSCRSNWI